MFKNKTIIGLLCIALAVATVLFVSPLIQRATMETEEIVRVTNDITQGTKLTKDNTEVVEVSGYNMPDNIIKKSKEVVGKYSTCDMKAGDYFMDSKLSENGDGTDDVLRNLYKQGKQAFSFEIKDLSSGLSGKLQQGDIIRLYHQDKKGEPVVTPNECQYLNVITSTTSKGVDTQDVEEKDDGTRDLLATVTVIVNDEQAKVLQQCKTDGENSFSLIYRGDPETAQKYVEMQDEYFKTGQINTGNNTNMSQSIKNYINAFGETKTINDDDVEVTLGKNVKEVK